MKVTFTRNGDDLIVSHTYARGVATEIGRTSASDTEARIFVTPESLLYVYTRGFVETSD